MINISVCIATYNGEKYIEAQLNSILLQLDLSDEIIISDDSSTDNTINIIETINDSRIKLFKYNKFRNYVKNFENSLKNSSGKYIFLADQDDIWLPNKVEISLQYLKDFNLVMTDCYYVNSHLEIFNTSFFENINVKKGFLNNFIKNSFLGCCMAFDRKILEASLPFPSKLNSHDHWICLISEIFGKTMLIPDKCIYFRRHGSNSSIIGDNDSMVSGKSSSCLFIIVYNRFYILGHLLKRFIKLSF